MCGKRCGIRGGGRPGGSTEPVTDTNSILQHRHGDVGMNWIPDLVAGLRDIAIVVFLGYGLKLMKQQNELLEREKALKQSEIDVHRANIERLKILQAPAIARDLAQMIRTADQLAKRKHALDERFRQLPAENKAVGGGVRDA